MNPFEYVTLMDFVAAAAVFILFYNLLVIVTKLVQVHALMSSSRGFSFNATNNVLAVSASSVAIYWHLVIPGPGV